MLRSAGRWVLLLLAAGAVFAIGLGAWLLGGDSTSGPVPPTPAQATPVPTASAGGQQGIATASATPARDAAELLERALDHDRALSALPDSVRSRMTPSGAAREYFDRTASFDYRSLSSGEVRAAERALARLLLERLTGAAHEQMRELVVDYEADTNRAPVANWLWRQEHAVESAALLEETAQLARVSVVVRFARWFAGGEELRMRSVLLLDLERDAFGIWRISGWEARGDTVLP